jgi:hypothetical protein
MVLLLVQVGSDDQEGRAPEKDSPVADIQTANGPNSKGNRFESWSPSRERLALFDSITDRLAELFAAQHRRTACSASNASSQTRPG